jgi:histidyl-tRNA synthetase
MRARLRHADAARVRWVVVFGEDEVKDGKVTLRDMAATEPETLSTEAALERIKRDEQMQTHLGSGTFSMESS